MELRKVVEKLRRKGTVAEVREEKSRSFDLAFVEDRAYLIKLVGNADSLSQDSLESFRKCASVVGADPLVVSKKCKSHGGLTEGVVYQRYGVPVMSGETFLKYLDNHEVALADRGGVKVPMEHVKEAREALNMSRNLLAERLEVTPEMVRRYEEGQAEPGREMAEKMRGILGGSIVRKVSFKVEGSEKAFIGRAPFELAFRKEGETFLVSFKDHPQRVRNLKQVAEVLEAEAVVSKSKKLEDMGF
ncbi:MAG TPA: helix-turn-helix domain-containing protein [archaeon]|nr:helix-turn-helix domain-containing protein [archaeon]